MDEERLPGGFVNVVVRVGDTVRRQPGERASFVHELLAYLEERRWPGAPRFLGIDERGREVLSYLDGQVAWHKPADPDNPNSPDPETPGSPANPDPTKPETPGGLANPGSLANPDSAEPDPADPGSNANLGTGTIQSLRAVGRLVREFHDLTAGTPLAADQEVVCHNDLSPKNTVYADDFARPIAFIDWDLAAPGPRINDLAFCCWQYADLGRPDPQGVAEQWRALCDGYGPTDRTALVDTVLWWQDRARRGIESGAAAGDSAMSRLVEFGVPAEIRKAHAWVAAHSGVLGQVR